MYFRLIAQQFRHLLSSGAGPFLRCALCGLLLASCGSPPDENATLLQIETEYRAILHALPTMRMESRDGEGADNEHMKVSAYRDASGALRLLTFEFSGNAGKMLKEHYYANDELIFALYRDYRYDRPDSLAEDRYYFNGGRMIRWVKDNKILARASAKQIKDAEKEVLEWSDMLQSGARASAF